MTSESVKAKCNAFLQLMQRPNIILGSYIVFIIYHIIEAYQHHIKMYQLIHMSYHLLIILFYLLWLLLIIIFSFLIIRGKIFALWVMGVCLLGCFPGIIWGLVIPWRQYITKLIFFILGSYFVWGGIILIRQARILKRSKAEQSATDGHR